MDGKQNIKIKKRVVKIKRNCKKSISMQYKNSIYGNLGKSFSSAMLNSVQFKVAIRGVLMKQ